MNESLFPCLFARVACDAILFHCNRAFVLQAILLATGKRKIAEASPYDKIWGIGLDERTAVGMSHTMWPGQNLLGKVLMQLRDELRCSDEDRDSRPMAPEAHGSPAHLDTGICTSRGTRANSLALCLPLCDVVKGHVGQFCWVSVVDQALA